MDARTPDFGEVEIEKQITGEVRKIDLYFCPNPDSLEDLKALAIAPESLNHNHALIRSQ
jgi:hypothetical protein